MTSLLLTINRDGKPMPYPRIHRADGTENHGFILLKDRGAPSTKIAEAGNEPALLRLLSILNARDSSVFSIGCDASLGRASDGWWKRGYVEFALDSLESAGEPVNSFDVFYRFDRHLRDVKFAEKIEFHWELEANQLRTGDTFMSIVCWITTGVLPSKEAASTVWDRGVDTLGEFAGKMKNPQITGTPISMILARDST